MDTVLARHLISVTSFSDEDKVFESWSVQVCGGTLLERLERALSFTRLHVGGGGALRFGIIFPRR